MTELSIPPILFSVLAGLVFSAGSLAPTWSRAEVTVKDWPQYLKTTEEDPVTKEITIYAARTFQNGIDCTVNNPSFTNVATTCNSCVKIATLPLSTPLPCNDQEIHPNLAFSITLRSSDAADYPTCMQPIEGRRAGDTTTLFSTTQQTTYTPGVANQDVTANFTWNDICSAAGSAGCAQSFNEKFEFGFDRSCNQTTISAAARQFRIRFRFVSVSPPMTFGCNGAGAYEGICNYVISPGDQKVFVKGIDGVIGNGFLVPNLENGATDAPDNSGMRYSAFRIYYRPTAQNAPNSMTFGDTHKDLQIEGTQLKESRVTGLTNGTEYFFWGAMVDQAGTVTHLPPISSLTAAQAGTPEEVYGLLDQKGCFIATAAYGTDQAKEIQILRDFRDIFLARSEAGRGFIAWYYRHSPEWAAVIRDHEVLRGVVRAFLSPMIGMADLSLRYGGLVLYVSLLSIFSLIGAGTLCARLRRRKKSGTP